MDALLPDIDLKLLTVEYLLPHMHFMFAVKADRKVSLIHEGLHHVGLTAPIDFISKDPSHSCSRVRSFRNQRIG